MKQQEDLNSLNGTYTAIPKQKNSAAIESGDVDLIEEEMEFGKANEKEARESGYVGADGKAVELAKPDVKGSPTGAYTDIGAGRSSVVHQRSDQEEGR
jgi:hypothetical protein